jgi:hypothetical protein
MIGGVDVATTWPAAAFANVNIGSPGKENSVTPTVGAWAKA